LHGDGDDEPDLVEMTRFALDRLVDADRGFVLLIEGSSIDSAGHYYDPGWLVHDIREFDQALSIALNFARQRKDTLLVALADHETGGFNIVKGAYKDGHLEFIWNSNGHTGQPVSMFAFGPHAIRFTGMKDNTEIPKIFAELLKLEKFPR
ncbi:alkaline phosphatase, partial [candidate division KSB1 bacterium]|nr:alkaline phosphatase [candidate division KSB1 bacterium]